MTDDATREGRDPGADIDWVRLERAEVWINRLVWLAPAITFSAILLIRLTRSWLLFTIILFGVPFLSILCFEAIFSVLVELKDLCCRLRLSLKAAAVENEELENLEEGG
ncbi:MAG: hypothetical protein ACYSW4_05420 [Planctomycetota bacterium]|jgi:hypothetical protein